MIKTMHPKQSLNSYCVNWRVLGATFEQYCEDYREAVELFNKLPRNSCRELWGWAKNNGVSTRLMWEESEE